MYAGGIFFKISIFNGFLTLIFYFIYRNLKEQGYIINNILLYAYLNY